MNNSFLYIVSRLRQKHFASLSRHDSCEPFDKSGKYLKGSDVTHVVVCLCACVYLIQCLCGKELFRPLTPLWSHGSQQSKVTPSWQGRINPQRLGLLAGSNKIITLHCSPDQQQIVSLSALSEESFPDVTLNGSHQRSLLSPGCLIR